MNNSDNKNVVKKVKITNETHPKGDNSSNQKVTRLATPRTVFYKKSLGEPRVILENMILKPSKDINKNNE